MTARSFLWLRSCSSSQPSLSAFQFCSDFQERASVHTFFFYGSGRPRPKGRRLVRWTGHAQGPAPSNGLCSSQRGNVDGLATTDNRLLSPERYLLTTLTANGLHTKESVWWYGWFNSLVFFVSRPVVCARLPRRPKRRKGGASRDGVPCAVHALRQRLHLPEEQASGGGGLPCAWGHHRRWLQQQAVPAHLQRFLAAGADAGGPRLQRGGVRPGEGGREPERRVAGRGEDPGRRHFPSQEEKVGLRREGHRRPDQHLLRRADGVRGRERHQLRHGGHVGGWRREHGRHRRGARPHHRRRGLVHPHPGEQEPASGAAGSRLQRPAAQLLRRQVPAGGGADPRGPRPRRGSSTRGDVHRRGLCGSGGAAAVVVS